MKRAGMSFLALALVLSAARVAQAEEGKTIPAETLKGTAASTGKTDVAKGGFATGIRVACFDHRINVEVEIARSPCVGQREQRKSKSWQAIGITTQQVLDGAQHRHRQADRQHQAQPALPNAGPAQRPPKQSQPLDEPAISA